MSNVVLPTCLSKFVHGKASRLEMGILCFLNILLTLLPTLIFDVFCGEEHMDDDFSALKLLVTILLVNLSILSLGNAVPRIVHVICYVVWWIVTALLVTGAVTIIQGLFYAQPCPAAMVMSTIVFLVEMCVFVYGVVVYWNLEWRPASQQRGVRTTESAQRNNIIM